MKNGDIYNWAYAILGVMMLYMASTMYILASLATDKYMAALAQFGFIFWGGVISIAVTGIFSIITKRSVPFLGALFGIALFLAVCAFSMAAFVGFVFVGAIFNMPNHIWRGMLDVGYIVILIGVPIVSFGFAFFRKPKGMFQQSVPGYPPQGVGSPEP